MDENTILVELTIDEDLRTITIPNKGMVFGVVGDIEVNRVKFILPAKYYRGFDLSEFKAKVNYVNPNGDSNYYEAESIISQDSKLFFVWLMASDVTAYSGDVKFSVTLYKTNDSFIEKRFNTRSATGRVLDGLNVETYVTPEQQQTLLQKLENDIKEDFNRYVDDIKEQLISDVKSNIDVPTKTSELENDSHFLTADTEISWGRKDGTFAGMQSVALGLDAEAFGDNSFAEGNNTVAYGDNSHAEGYQSQATGQNAHAEGENNIASGQGAHAEGGAGTTASDKYAHAEGYGTTASAQAAHSEGYNTYATGKYSHVEGYNSKATADMAHAENYGTEASGKNSHAEGLISIAKGNGSHAEGFGTVASGKYQHVQGKYNVEDTEGRYAHIVGGGSDTERRNIHTLDWEGNAEYAGDIIATVNGKKVPMSTIAGFLLQPGASAHNAIYREQYLGDTVTAEQAAAIADGSFEDLFIGAYWTMGGVNYRIADFDYWYRTGFPEASRVKKHHAVIVPDTAIATGQMNGSNTTSGGYRNSLIKSKMNDTILALPPEIRSRLLVHNALLDGAWTEISVDPMNEIMVYGCYILADNSNKQTSENRQLSLFRMSPQARYAGGNYWLRNYANATEFTLVSYYGDASKDAATSTYGIRPVFAITGD